jgi:hypothetical protein
MIKPDWNIFKTKFSENPQDNFEWLSYLLFCQEFKKPLGIFGYFNQRNIETNPIKVGKEVIGWQAKFYDTTLSQNKSRIIKLVRGSKKDFPSITKIVLYTNQLWGQGKKQNDPVAKKEIDQVAKSIGVKIDWNHTENFFKSPFVVKENKIIAKHFFSLDKSLLDLLKEQKNHNERILEEIRTQIKFGDKIIEIDRGNILESLEESNQVTILSGIGGVGKTAVIKNYYERIKTEIPVYIFKASEFELRNLNDLFNNNTIDDFVDAHEKEKQKIIIIDSSEKLLELNNTDPFKEFLRTFISNNWKIIFTTRDNYLEDLNYHFFEIYEIVPLNLKITNIELLELEKLSQQFSFLLPADRKLIELIRNPFYLNEYLKFNKESETIDYSDFKKKLWNKIIKKSKPSREQCFLQVANHRAKEGQFFINPDCDPTILDNELVKDGLLGYESAGYFITHDIYEEWALEKNIEIQFVKKESNSKFFKELGSNLIFRRSLRNWISEKLLLEDNEIKNFIEEVLNDDEIQSFWKDEILVSALLSNYSERLFIFLKNKLLENNFNLLKKLAFLLKIACKEIDEDFLKLIGIKQPDLFSLEYVTTKPKGQGWGNLIKFVHENIEAIEIKNIGFIMPIIFDWNDKFKTGITTRLSSLIALKYYQYIIDEDIFFSEKEDKKRLIKTIIHGAKEIKDELKEILEKVILNKWKYHRDPYYELSKAILTKMYGFVVSNELPNHVIKLANLFWVYTERKGEFNYHSGIGVEQYFGLEEDQLRYFPSSAYQTPIYWLLKASLNKTVKFIIDFTNKATESYYKSDLDKNEVSEIEIFIDDKNPVKQFISNRLWCTYRGTQVSPDVLESMLMALEKVFLEYGKDTDSEVLENWLIYLLQTSKSASITALVASIVLAYPEKTFNVAKILFKTKELFKYDSNRVMLDYSTLCPLGADENGQLYQNERIESKKLKHRTWSLENQMVNYQFFRSKNTSEEEAGKRQEKIWEIIDNYHKNLPSEAEETDSDKVWRTFLTRVDKRKMNPTFKETDEGFEIHLNPEMEPKLAAYNEKKLKEISEPHKFGALKLWASYKALNDERFKTYEQYEKNPKLALKEVKEIINTLKESNDGRFHLFNESIPAEVCSVIVRDHFIELSKEERLHCKDIILEVAAITLTEGYRYQVSDGTQLAISVLPILINEFPEDRVIIKLILLANLFKKSRINVMGMGFSSFAANAINKLWENNYDDAQSLLFCYLLLAPRYEEFWMEQKRDNFKNGIYRMNENEVINKFIKQNEIKLEDILANNNIKYKLTSITNTDLDILYRAFQIIPLKTKDTQHKDFVLDISIVFSKTLLNKKKDDKIEYSTRHGFLEKLSLFTLSSPINEIEDVLRPFLDNFDSSEAIADLMEQFISAEDKLNSYDNFWKVWILFKDKVVTLCKDGDKYWYTGQIIKGYLFALNQWKDSAKEWRSFKPENSVFFKEISEKIGHCPSTLYAISKLLNKIGSSYSNEGIFWISKMLEKNQNLIDAKSDENTIYYLEKLTRKFIHVNREQTKSKVKIKNDLLVILNYLINKGSVIGYMLRESIL